jgi:Rrf2 family protein
MSGMLTQKAKYGLKALLMLAQQGSNEYTLVADIAERQHAPRKYLELILLELRKHGILHSQRGKNGGFRLARPAGDITFGQIIRVLDGPLAPFPCASLTAYRKCEDCTDEQVCAVRKQMRRVRDAVAGVLDTTTLTDALAPALALEVTAEPARLSA